MIDHKMSVLRKERSGFRDAWMNPDAIQWLHDFDIFDSALWR